MWYKSEAKNKRYLKLKSNDNIGCWYCSIQVYALVLADEASQAMELMD